MNADSRHDVFDGGTHTDVISFPVSGPVTLNLTTGQASGFGDDRVRALEIVSTTDDGDTLIGDDGRNVLFGRGGADHIEGRGRNDFLNGGGGSDFLDGGNGSDVCKRGETVVSCEISP